MKIPTIILFFFGFVSCSGQLEMQVQGIFTEADGQVYANRILCDFTYPDHIAEPQMIKDDVELFYEDIVLNANADRGRWDNFYDFNGLLPLDPTSASRRYEPHYRRANSAISGTYPDENYSSERLHEAANLAFALSFSTSDYEISGITKPANTIAKELALAVWNEILAMANDDKLDASNGGKERLSGEPNRINTSYGQTVRFNHMPEASKSNRVGIQRGEPYYLSAMKIVKVIHSYGLVKEIIKNESDFINNEQFVNYWILDWTRWAYAQYNRFFVNSFGSNWRALERNFETTQSFSGSDDDQAYTYYDQNGNGVNRVTDAQRFTLNNRELIYPLLVKTYATYFNDADFEAWAYDVFKVYIALGIYADGTHHEMYRLGSNAITSLFPMVYPELSSAILLAWARTHEVGVKNGALSDADKYWSYTSSLGSDELYRIPWETSTSGGKKGLELILENIAGYLKSEDQGGVVGNRFNKNGILIDNRDQTMTAIYAMANRYYDNELFQNIIERNGYPDYEITSLASLPTEAGAAWGLYLAMGGETAILPADQNNNLECENIEFPETDPDPDPDSSDENEENDENVEESGENSEENIDESDEKYAMVQENPVRESTIKIQKQDADCVTIRLYDLTAKLLLQEDRCGENIDVNIPFLTQNSLYFLQLINLEHNQTIKLFL